MNVSRIFIERPVATTVLIISLVFFGIIAFFNLAISELPNVDFPTIVVTADLTGADPETMATSVATPLEKELSTVPGIDSMSSVSSAGSTRITLQFALDRDIDAAAQDVQSAILQASHKLPSQMTTQPSVRKVNPADAPILYIALTAGHMALTKLDDYAENSIAPHLSMTEGVAQVDVYGAQQYAVRIHLNPYALANRGLSITQIGTAINNLNSNQPVGTLQSNGYYRGIKADGELTNAAAFNDAVVADVNGAPVRVKDIGLAEDSVANDKAITWFGDQQAIVLAVDRQPGANTVAVVNSIKKMLPELTRELPGGAELHIVYDRSYFINAAIKDVEYTLIFAAFLVVAVIFLFFNNFTPTLIAVLSLPTSIIATFGVMYLFNYSLDNLSLMALVLAVGFVIDDAVVVLENIIRYAEQGLDRVKASLVGSAEICFTVIAMTISLVAVFIPIFFMQGLIGRLFHEFAAVVGISILLSGVIALTLIPMLCSRFLHVEASQNQPRSWFERLFLQSKAYYERTLRWSVERVRWVLLLALGLFVVTIGLFYVVPKGFIPSEDANIVFATVQASQGVTFPEFVKEQQQAADIIAKDSDVAGMVSSVGQGSGGTASGNTGRIIIHLKPLSERFRSADEIINDLRKKLNQVAGLNIYLVNPPAIRIGGKVSSSNYQYVLQGTDWDQLQQAALQLEQAIAKISGVEDVNDDLQMNNPQLRLHILRDKAAALGITPNQIEEALYSAYGESEVSTIMTETGDYSVIMDIDPKYQLNVTDLNVLSLHAEDGTVVPLSSVVTVTNGAGPLSVSHYGQLPAVTVSFNLSPKTSLGDVAGKISNLATEILPKNISGSFIGSAQMFQQSMQTLPILLLFTVLIIYAVLAILYEHFGHPVTILTALPFAGFGAILSLLVFQQELDIFSFIGLIMLVGLTKKNGIMMVDFALEAKRTENLMPKDAIIKACLIRFRPIMMTTLAAIVATLPIALGLGAGGETRQAMGVAVVGGLLFSQLITLYVTPAFYLLMSKFK